MMRDFFLWLLTSLVVDPMQAEWGARLGAAGAPPPVVAGLARCAGEAAPALASRAAGDPGWGVTTVAGVWLGVRDSMAVVAEATPGCAAAVETARPFLARPPS
jgi:hypothetical protein